MIKRRNSKSLISRGWLTLFAIMVIAAPGCNKKAPPPPQATPLPKKTAPAPSAPAKPVMASRSTVKSALQRQISSVKKPLPPGGVSLDFTNRRDPFRPFVQAPAVLQKSSGSKLRDALPIQSFDTEKFRITGIITGIREN